MLREVGAPRVNRDAVVPRRGARADERVEFQIDAERVKAGAGEHQGMAAASHRHVERSSFPPVTEIARDAGRPLHDERRR